MKMVEFWAQPLTKRMRRFGGKSYKEVYILKISESFEADS